MPNMVSSIVPDGFSYSKAHTFRRICAATYNVAGQKPDVSLLPWLFKKKETLAKFSVRTNSRQSGHRAAEQTQRNSEYGPSPDIFIIGFQEVVELTPRSVLAPDAECAKAWEKSVDLALMMSKEDYVKIVCQQLVGLLTIIYVRRQYQHQVSNIRLSLLPTGLGGMLGNKGAIAVRFDWGGTSVCVVNVHMAAFDKNIDQRNKEYHMIVSRTSWGDEQTLFDHDFVFWLGDLNYRVSEKRAVVAEKILADDLTYLLQKDQLNTQRKNGAAFREFREGPVLFAPTYKFDKQSQVYDSSAKKRIPSWTDRILWYGLGCNLVFYGSAEEIMTSDHRPVSALFDIPILTDGSSPLNDSGSWLDVKKGQVHQRSVSGTGSVYSEAGTGDCGQYVWVSNFVKGLWSWLLCGAVVR
mmetsp:Transcript_41564/g.67455  ORF Transcript_41564/g.67455 Transcript_41564/m.67455 type:complete len:409 (+) Transcript_41564:103-1329(+)|eukprot:CAMPEP_0184649630 /NCGR_PEP_ID=MMETSP0308-20130426/7029_1 /TAXON_ID=38269 /ORGANISM="Gloeochaete witrockiana, Strain SAG 46.84" /LENGTH=408 /DNA_ID=CAMNT_0027082505 /DNA_START=103 /DNA_END=1329 /DNA_ORIENTATION=-